MIRNEMHRLVVVFAFICAAYCQSTVDQSEDGNSGTIKFSTPDLNDEEAHSPWMPDQLKCDACKSITYQLYNKFQAVNKKRKSLKYNLPESEILDMFEAVCGDQKVWEGYGVKEVKGEKRLSGAGTEVADVPGVTAGGGKWPGRIRDMCETYSGELGENEIYNVYKKKPTKRSHLEDFLCRGAGIRGDCLSENERKKKDEL